MHLRPHTVAQTARAAAVTTCTSGPQRSLSLNRPPTLPHPSHSITPPPPHTHTHTAPQPPSPGTASQVHSELPTESLMISREGSYTAASTTPAPPDNPLATLAKVAKLQKLLDKERRAAAALQAQVRGGGWMSCLCCACLGCCGVGLAW